MTNPVLVEVLRGGHVESFHRGAWAVVDADGALLSHGGDIDRPIFPRSAVKVLQALPLVASGAADHFGLDDAALALACASHGGEPEHVAVAGRVLAQLGLDEHALECGAHWPGFEPAKLALARTGDEPHALHNNCSGKHAGFACLGCWLAKGQGQEARGFLSGYVQPEHPVMQAVSHALETATGFALRDAPMGVDGCSIPTFGIPLRHLALGFARVATGQGLGAEHARAALRLRQAVARQPFMVAGTGRFDTQVMQHFGERVFCKVGAEGVYCAAFPEHGLGVALKVDDGNNARAAEVAMAALIAAWVQKDDDDAAVLTPLSHPRLSNWRGVGVGALQPSAHFLAAASKSK
ncbi:MAG: asparaginase [Ideonella sp. MAG2]|nr:MAG: asparaginase [Ideonella sp. MAG2]